MQGSTPVWISQSAPCSLAYFVAKPIKVVRGISGESAMFMCRLITYGSPRELSYQWYKGEICSEDQKLEGETSNILTLKSKQHLYYTPVQYMCT